MVDRAHTLILKVGTDTKSELVAYLHNFAHELERDQITAGCSGGASSGAIYAYRHDPAMTHDEYFRQLEPLLRKGKAGRDHDARVQSSVSAPAPEGSKT